MADLPDVREPDDVESAAAAATTLTAKMTKPSVFAEAADPAKYRVKDAALFTCAAHTDATVLCTTAGKNGRNGRTAAVGATILWLTCPHVNNFVARVERYGGVQAAARCLRSHEELRQRHIASHKVYVDRVKDLLQVDQWDFFRSHFVSPADEAAKKFGNAAVCHEDDLKCLHALVAQTLGGAPNPLGDAVVNYILLCCKLVDSCADADMQRRQAVSALINSDALFEAFLTQTIAEHKDRCGTAVDVRVPLPTEDADDETVSIQWAASVECLAALQPDLCQRCLALTVFLDGKPPTARRKHRLN